MPQSRTSKSSGFKFFIDWADEPKVQVLPEYMQRRFVMLLCEDASGAYFTETERAFHWRVSDEEFEQTKKIFIDKGLIDEEWNVLEWRSLYRDTKTKADRDRRFRARQKEDALFGEITDEDAQPGKKPKRPVDPRFVDCVEQIDKYWKYINGPTAKLPAGAAMGKQLNMFLSRYPELTMDDFRHALGNRALSEDCNQHAEPAQYLPRLNYYFDGPHDKYGRPKQVEVEDQKMKGID